MLWESGQKEMPELPNNSANAAVLLVVGAREVFLGKIVGEGMFDGAGTRCGGNGLWHDPDAIVGRCNGLIANKIAFIDAAARVGRDVGGFAFIMANKSKINDLDFIAPLHRNAPVGAAAHAFAGASARGHGVLGAESLAA